MKTFTLSGQIKSTYIDDWTHLVLIGDNGLNVDLVYRLHEIISSFPKSKIQVNYWLSKAQKTRGEAIQQHTEHLLGIGEAAYEENGTMYSEWTGYVESYERKLTIGGHNLDSELQNHEGEYLIIDFNVIEQDA